ncbi:hypothetical protein WR25_07406 [Diploscapter pachys]|uniref:Sphingomyelin synthase-like domain-containing protein n=1 Tax=Diploscapter pachys TaxID=2018661 RepID=A0A2A2KR09_9BILA|nr:hypothetical protein WR25_07406 [Diploscapter pachys]
MLSSSSKSSNSFKSTHFPFLHLLKHRYYSTAKAKTDSDSASPHSHSQHSHSHSAASTTSAGGGGNRMTFVQSAIGCHSLWLKLLVLFLYLFLSGLSNWAVLSYTHDIIPRDPLPDILFRLIPEQKWASFWGDMMVTACLIQLILMIVFHSFRSVILRRALFILATLYLMRSAVLLATQLPSGYTNNAAMCREQLNRSDPSVFFSRLFAKN